MVAFITELNDSNYTEFTTKHDFVLVDVWAEWCGPCRVISPIIDQLSVEYQGKLSVGKLNADDSREIVQELKVRSIPSIILYKDGEIVDKSVGSVTKESLVEMINKHISE